jgi:hypothetical protein
MITTRGAPSVSLSLKKRPSFSGTFRASRYPGDTNS